MGLERVDERVGLQPHNGFIWNRETVNNPVDRLRLQPHNGFIWNGVSPQYTLTSPSLQPHNGFIWNVRDRPTAVAGVEWLQPHNGFIWNHALIGHVHIATCRLALSVSVDPQSPPNPPRARRKRPSTTTRPIFRHRLTPHNRARTNPAAPQKQSMHTVTFGVRLRTRTTTLDALALAGVPVVLCAVYALPEPIKRGLVFDYATPTLLTAYTAHFVHFDPAHLFVNLGSYVLLVPVAYALAALSDDLSRFRVAVVTLHTAVPLALSALNLAIVRPRVGYGFSGVAMGLLALTALFASKYTATRLATGWWRRGDAPLVFCAEVTLIALAVRPRSLETLAVAGGAATVTAGYLLVVARRVQAAGRTFSRTASRVGFGELGLVAGIVLAGFPAVAFPADPAGDGTVLNLYTHLLGFALTFVAAYALPEIDG